MDETARLLVQLRQAQYDRPLSTSEQSSSNCHLAAAEQRTSERVGLGRKSFDQP